MILRFFGVVVFTAVLLGACGGASDGGDVLEGENVEVLMFDNRFEYTEIRIPIGGSVNWLGAGRNPHNSVDAEDAWSTEEFGEISSNSRGTRPSSHTMNPVNTSSFAHFTATQKVREWPAS